MIHKKDPATFSDYLLDNSGLPAGSAEEIAFPETAAEVAELLRQCRNDARPVTIAGAGTGIVGGRIPCGGVILASDRLNRILQINRSVDKAGGWAVIEPGVRLEELSVAAASQGLAYPPDPTEKKAFLGGTVATNASGARGFKYGATRRYVRALGVALIGGDILELRRGEGFLRGQVDLELVSGARVCFSVPTYQLPVVKNAAGYYAGEGLDLIDLFIGQEGTLGAVTRIEVGLVPLAQGVCSGLAFFHDEAAALSYVAAVQEISWRDQSEITARINASCLEYFDERSLAILRERYHQIPRAAAAVYFDQENTAAAELDIMTAYSDLLARFGALDNDIWFASTEQQRGLLAGIRYDLPVMINERVKRNGFAKLSTDIAVPQRAFAVFFAYMKTQLQEIAAPYAVFGHIGESHLHLNLMPETAAAFRAAQALYRRLLVKAIELRGTIAAEHGIGKLKQQYLGLMFGDDGVRQMRQVKRAFDPLWLLGRGTLFESPEARD